MFRYAKGYHRTWTRIIKPNRYYVLCLFKIRKPYLLRLECETKYLAKRYIILKTNPVWHEVISGKEAIKLGFKITTKKVGRKASPEKYNYPPGCTTWQKKKQHRTNYRAAELKAFNKFDTLSQFTVLYRGKTYTAYEYTITKAFKAIEKYSSMTWNHFIKHVSNKPYKITKKTIFIRTINIIHINQFNKYHNGSRIKYPPNRGKVWPFESSYFSTQRPKPKRLLF